MPLDVRKVFGLPTSSAGPRGAMGQQAAEKLRTIHEITRSSTKRDSQFALFRVLSWIALLPSGNGIHFQQGARTFRPHRAGGAKSSLSIETPCELNPFVLRALSGWAVRAPSKNELPI